MGQSLTYQNKSFQVFDAELKVDLKDKKLEDERKKFLIYLVDNLELLKKFSDVQLEKILKYSKEENERKRRLLKK